MVKVIKRNGKEVSFDENKIKKAVKAANDNPAVVNKMSEQQMERVFEKVIGDCLNQKGSIDIENIQNRVEEALISVGAADVARAYIKYRYERELVRKSNTTDESILALIRNENKELAEENSNKNTMLASTQRDYVAGEVSRDLTKRILLPEKISKAHEEGILHFHDADYFLQPIFNCCLINIGDMLDNGTVMNGKMIESPKSFQVACTVMTQIIASVASSQYGGQSVDLRHLGKYLRKSRDKFYKKTKEKFGDTLSDEQVNAIVDERVKDELRAGVQTIQYQINTLMTTNGQSPFVTLFLNLRKDDEYIKENAMIIEEVLTQRLQGIKNEVGVYVTPAFPKLVYVLDEHNCLKGGKYDYLTRLAVKCSAKRMYPDYISAKKMRENYEGNVFSPMGCVDGQEVVTYKLFDQLYVESFERMWDRLKSYYAVKEQHPGNPYYLYMDTEDVFIYDTKKGFVKNHRIIRNKSENWMRLKFSNGRTLTCTDDHPFETENRGVVLARELTSDDIIMYSDNIDFAQDLTDKEVCQRKSRTRFCHLENQEALYYTDYSYDVTTESEHFEVSGMYSHNCRSFLSPWKDENGNYKFEGRFNQGVVSINLPQIGIVANGDINKFWELFDERLELCYEALMCRHNALKGVKSDISPIHWQYGAIARLKKGETIDKLLYGGYSTMSLGYIGLYELTKLMTGVSHTEPRGTEFALKVMNHMNDKCKEWKSKTNIGFALYGTPAESLCYRFARIDKNRFGSIPDITDKGYYTNSYHVDVREHIDAFDKFVFESQFQKISTGGCISYVEIPNMRHNLDALESVVKFIYDNIQYAEFNTKSDYCHVCGYDGEIIVNDDNEWECPSCHNKDHSKMNVTRRTCGYLGENFWNVGKTKEIKSRVLHL